MHVQDKEHLNKKIYSKIKRLNNGVLVNDKVVVEENAWHSMTDDTCTICNTDFDDEHSHKNMSIHIINLVGSKLEYGPNETIYRRVSSLLYLTFISLDAIFAFFVLLFSKIFWHLVFFECHL